MMRKVISNPYCIVHLCAHQELTTSGLLCFTLYQRLYYTINGFSFNTSVLAAAHTVLKLRFFISVSETSAKVKHAGLVREAWRFRNMFGLHYEKSSK